MDASDASSSPPSPSVLPPDRPLPLTGERTTPGVREENYWFQRHVAAYDFAAARCAGKRTLDAGSGEGYGADILARAGAEVTGVDLEEPVVERARARYPRARFDAADLTALPYADGSFDAVVSLQVIEHLPSPEAMVRECARVLAPGGVLILSTPNRLTFSPDGIRNPFHTIEFAPEELRSLLAAHFASARVLGTFHTRWIGALERALRQPFPERLIAQPPHEWPAWLRLAVARVRPSDFPIRGTGVDASLDLVAIAHRG